MRLVSVEKPDSGAIVCCIVFRSVRLKAMHGKFVRLEAMGLLVLAVTGLFAAVYALIEGEWWAAGTCVLALAVLLRILRGERRRKERLP